MVTATLNKHDNLDLILAKQEEVRIYPVQTDTQPGMCVAVFNQPKSPDVATLIQTVSAEGLDGTWHVYYRFNKQLTTRVRSIGTDDGTERKTETGSLGRS